MKIEFNLNLNENEGRTENGHVQNERKDGRGRTGDESRRRRERIPGREGMVNLLVRLRCDIESFNLMAFHVFFIHVIVMTDFLVQNLIPLVCIIYIVFCIREVSF